MLVFVEYLNILHDASYDALETHYKLLLSRCAIKQDWENHGRIMIWLIAYGFYFSSLESDMRLKTQYWLWLLLRHYIVVGMNAINKILPILQIFMLDLNAWATPF